MSRAASLAFRRIVLAVQVLAGLCVAVVLAALLAGMLPSLFGYDAYVVYGGSMEPTISVGSLAVTGPVPPGQLQPGDIITYRSAADPNVVVTHRLMKIERDEQGRTVFTTKGDANQTEDQVAPDPNAVLGRVVYSVPKIGYVVDFTRRPEGKLALLGIPAAFLFLDWLKGVSKRRRQTPEAAPAQQAALGLIARGRTALDNGENRTALALFDHAIATDPHQDEAWLLKAQCLGPGPESVACLQAGLTVNPASARLRQALEDVAAQGASR